MITEKNNVFYCDCGFSFQRGRSGAHDCAEGLRIKLAESEAKCAALAAENAGLKQGTPDLQTMMSALDAFFADEEVPERAMLAAYNILRGALETPATDAFLAEVRASAIPEGYVLVPQEMHLSSEAMEGICFHCGDGDHKFGEFTDGTLFVGEVDYGDGKKVHGLHIATADYPEEGCATICEFAAQLRKGVQS